MINIIGETRYKKGFSIIEIVISISLITVGILSILGLFLSLTKSVIISKNKLIATYMAEENIEIVRQIRDNNWLQGAPGWDQNIGAGDKVIMPNDVDDIRFNFKVVNKNSNSEKVYEDPVNGGYFQVLPPGLVPALWKLTSFKRWMVITKPDANTIKIVSYVTYDGKEMANVTAVLKNWKN